MTENKYQDEKYIEIAKKLKESVQKGYEEFIDTCNNIRKDEDFDIGSAFPEFYSVAYFPNDDKSSQEEIYLPSIAEAYLTTNDILENSIKDIDFAIIDRDISNFETNQKLTCAMYPLHFLRFAIKSFEFLEEEKLIDKTDNYFYYMFINPRKDVVEYALENKDYFYPTDTNKQEYIKSFVESYQAIPELRDLVISKLN